MNTPEQIVAGLTDAQRRLVIASEPDDISGREGVGVDLHGSMYLTAKTLRRMALGDYTHGSFYADMYWNTPLGLAVRAILKEQADAK